MREEALFRKFPGAPGRRRHRARQQRLQAVRAHQHVERGGRGAAGRGHVLAQRGPRRAPSDAAIRPSPPRSRAQAGPQVRQAGRPRRRRGPGLRRAGRHRPDRSRKPRSPRPSGSRRRPDSTAPVARNSASATARCAALTSEAATATVMPRPIAAGVLGMARTTAPPQICGNGGDRHAGHDRDHQRRRVRSAVSAPRRLRETTAASRAITSVIDGASLPCQAD